MDPNRVAGGRRGGWARGVGLPLVALIAVVCAGCVSVPDSGPIQQTEPGQQAQAQDTVRTLARPPRDGMNQTEIVEGFLDAATGFDDGQAVARQYLTPAAARKWDPDSGSRVLADGSRLLTQQGETAVDLTAAQMASISAAGQYEQLTPAQSLAVTITVEQVDGQWRIADPPPGLLLSRSDVQRSMRSVATYFVASPGGVVTPDLLAVPNSGQDLATFLVTSMLQGPDEWLEPAVLTGFPAGTRLLGDVVVDNGVALVDLSEQARAADPTALEWMSAQSVWTLRQVEGVVGVRLSIAGVPVVVPPQSAVQGVDGWPAYDPDVPTGGQSYFVRSGRVFIYDGNAASTVAGAAGSADPEVADPVVALGRDVLSATDVSTPRILTVKTQPGARWSRATQQGRTAGGSYDRTGVLWLPAGSQGVRLVTSSARRTRPVKVPGPVEAVQISRDGSRAALVVRSGGASQLYLAAVARGDGLPNVSDPRLVPTSSVRSVAWRGADEVAVLTREAGSPAQTFLVELGVYESVSTGAPPRARTVTAAPGAPMLAASRDNRIWAFRDNAWVPVLIGQDPRYPG